MIKVAVADDVGMFREGLVMMLKTVPDIEITGVSTNGSEALTRVTESKPDVMITDIQMPEMDGIELTKELKKYYPEVHVVGLTMYRDDYLIVDMMEAGARGYLLKDSTKEQLIEAINAVNAGGYYFCESTSMKLSKLLAASKIEAFPKAEHKNFSEVEIAIIQHICQEYSSKQISERLNLGLRTIESYRHKIFEKTGAKNMAGMVIFAMKYGIYRP